MGLTSTTPAVPLRRQSLRWSEGHDRFSSSELVQNRPHESEPATESRRFSCHCSPPQLSEQQWWWKRSGPFRRRRVTLVPTGVAEDLTRLLTVITPHSSHG